MPDWLTDNQALWWTLGGVSLVIFVGSLILVPAMVVRIPADYFAHDERPRSRLANQRPAIRLALKIAKNVLGVVLMLGGLAMLVMPGQGLLTIFVGFLLIDFPRKYRLERWLVRKRWVHKPINWLRRKRGKPPIRTGPQGDSGADQESDSGTKP
jgi:hypothetical protein